jgi:hypothetical protein
MEKHLLGLLVALLNPLPFQLALIIGGAGSQGSNDIDQQFRLEFISSHSCFTVEGVIFVFTDIPSFIVAFLVSRCWFPPPPPPSLLLSDAERINYVKLHI